MNLWLSAWVLGIVHVLGSVAMFRAQQPPAPVPQDTSLEMVGNNYGNPDEQYQGDEKTDIKHTKAGSSVDHGFNKAHRGSHDGGHGFSMNQNGPGGNLNVVSAGKHKGNHSHQERGGLNFVKSNADGSSHLKHRHQYKGQRNKKFNNAMGIKATGAQAAGMSDVINGMTMQHGTNFGGGMLQSGAQSASAGGGWFQQGGAGARGMSRHMQTGGGMSMSGGRQINVQREAHAGGGMSHVSGGMSHAGASMSHQQQRVVINDPQVTSQHHHQFAAASGSASAHASGGGGMSMGGAQIQGGGFNHASEVRMNSSFRGPSFNMQPIQVNPGQISMSHRMHDGNKGHGHRIHVDPPQTLPPQSFVMRFRVNFHATIVLPAQLQTTSFITVQVYESSSVSEHRLANSVTQEVHLQTGCTRVGQSVTKHMQVSLDAEVQQNSWSFVVAFINDGWQPSNRDEGMLRDGDFVGISRAIRLSRCKKDYYATLQTEYVEVNQCAGPGGYPPQPQVQLPPSAFPGQQPTPFRQQQFSDATRK